jgi:hypothetical protein
VTACLVALLPALLMRTANRGGQADNATAYQCQLHSARDRVDNKRRPVAILPQFDQEVVPMSEVQQFDVKLSQPRKQRLALGIVVALIVIGAVIAIALAIANRSASPAVNSTMQVMPATTLMFASLHTQPVPNNVIADAWKDSKVARQIESGLELALMQAGFSWEDDIRPWLGDRISFGVIDVGGVATPAVSGLTPFPQAQLPGMIVAAQTIDRVKSDAFWPTSVRTG